MNSKQGKKDPLVSVIIPMYNCEKYIDRCICSLINQEYEEIEIIIVDDGSTDNGADIVKKLQDDNDIIKYFYQENSGAGAARNKAIRESKGKYLLFVDADDYLSKEYIAELVYCAEENQAELTIAGYTLVYENGKKEKEVVPERYIRNVSEEWAYRLSASGCHLYLRNFWVRNELCFHHENGARAEDVPIVLYSNVMARNISIVKNSGYYYFQHPGSAMNQKKKVIFLFPYQAFGDMYQRVKKQLCQNSKVYFDIGVIKFLAQFTFLIYRKADRLEKKRFREFVQKLLREDWTNITSEWKKNRRSIRFPIVQKMAIELFLLKYHQKINGRRE